MSEPTVMQLWTEFKASVAELERDMVKNTEKKNVSAGVQARKALRDLKRQIGVIVAATLVADARVTEEREKARLEK